MLEQVAALVVIGYGLIGLAAIILVRRPSEEAERVFGPGTDVRDLTQDEVMWLLLWPPASIVTGIVMVVAGDPLLDVLLRVVLVGVVACLGWVLLHYGPMGTRVVILLTKLRLPGDTLQLMVVPLVLPVALLILLRAA